MRREHDFFCTSSPKKSKDKTSRSAREKRKEKETEDEEQGLNDVRDPLHEWLNYATI